MYLRHVTHIGTILYNVYCTHIVRIYIYHSILYVLCDRCYVCIYDNKYLNVTAER